MVGRQIGAYQVLSLLGTGGMGEVYKARDVKLDRPVALKILPRAVASSRDRMVRFLAEARAASAINHPNVAHIYEIGRDQDLNYIAMEYVEGQTLSSKLRDLLFNPAEIVDIALQVAEALEEAHSRGIFHRDIKPSNIMVTPQGRVKVLDFGVAKVMHKPGDLGPSELPTALHTMPGVVVGTFEYMSPEQVRGEEVDHRTDIFSLGIVLYEMASGCRPFSGQSPTETLNRILNVPPESPSRFNRLLPAKLEQIIGKCLEKDRERRYQTAQELVIELKNLQKNLSSGAAVFTTFPESAGTIIRTSRLLVAASLVLFSGVIFTYLLWSPTAVETPPAIRSLVVQDLTDLLALQSEVARAIASEIRVQVAAEEEARLAKRGVRPVSPVVQEAYLKGVAFGDIGHFRQAIELDPQYAPAYAALASHYYLPGLFGAFPPREAFPRMREAALEALRLDDSLALAYDALARVKLHYEWDWKGAEEHFRQALRLNPGNADIHHGYVTLIRRSSTR